MTARARRVSKSDARENTIVGGRYQVFEVLGRGGMASVHRAVEITTQREVALKLLRKDDGEDDTESESDTEKRLARFEREARLAGSIDTEHIVRVYDAGVDEDGTAFMAMQLLRGGDLNDLIRKNGPLRPDLALRIAAQACLGLAKAHEAGVIHRDIKPGNIFLAHEAGSPITIKLLDFGIAKAQKPVHSADSHTLTQTGAMLGSPHYMSPEQIMTAKTIDHRTDIWSLGVVLFKCLTGRTPYDADAVGQLLVSIVANNAPSVQDFAPWVSPEVAELVGRTLQLRPELRPPTAAALFDAITALLPNGCAIEASMLAPLTEVERAHVEPRVPATVEFPTDARTVADPPRPAARSRKARWIVAGAAIVALGTFAAVFARPVRAPLPPVATPAPPEARTETIPAAPTVAPTITNPPPSAAAPNARPTTPRPKSVAPKPSAPAPAPSPTTSKSELDHKFE